MSYSQFQQVANERDLQLATILASLWGVSATQIELWSLTINGGSNHVHH